MRLAIRLAGLMLALVWLLPLPAHAHRHAGAAMTTPPAAAVAVVQAAPAPAPAPSATLAECCQASACTGLGCPLPVAETSMPWPMRSAWPAQAGVAPEGQPPDPWPRPPRHRA